MENNRNYRIRTNVNQDKVLNVNLNQDYDFLEILSLKINQRNLYKLHTSNYGVVVGRVLANGGVGIPNAKISVFIEKSEYVSENVIVSNLYPYRNTSSLNGEKVRYNLLTEEKLSNCHQNVGTFPSKRMVLDDKNVLETFDNYYKYTCTTNNSGDYMLFGIPTGNQILHVDIDLSDIGFLSQSPRDFVYKGYNIDLFENPNQFKKSTDLNSLSHIFSQDSNVYVQPFWGDETYSDNIAITRNDINITYKIEPTCIFMGSIVTDGVSTGISKKCIPSKKMGKMDELTTSSGTIEMIRKTLDGDVEVFAVKGTELIDANGTWCYQIPMNLDYITTDEYGNIVPTNDINIGIPTRTRVRFRIGLNGGNIMNYETGKMLVPHNPQTTDDLDYDFGKTTKDDEFGTKSFRDLMWNNVYTVKSYIPRIQYLNTDLLETFTGIKNTNITNGNNPIPYNNMRVKMPFLYTVVCALVKAFIFIVGSVNAIVNGINSIIDELNILGGQIGFGDIPNLSYVYIPSGLCPQLDGWYFVPEGVCDDNDDSAWGRTKSKILKKFGEDSLSIDYNNNDNPYNDSTGEADVDENSKDAIHITNKTVYLIQCMETSLAEEYEVIKFDFYNDWVNGLLYAPKWLKRVRDKKSYLFGLFSVKRKTEGCVSDLVNVGRRLTQQCAMSYVLNGDNKHYTKVSTIDGCDASNSNKQRCHKKPGRKYINIFKRQNDNNKSEGLLKQSTNDYDKQGNFYYYYRPCEKMPNSGNGVEKIAKLLATDIVLLGSLDECSDIPSVLNELQSTTFQLPSSLAQTNMEDTGYMYGSGIKTCSESLNRKDSGNDNFGTYKNIEGDKDLNIDDIPMTEMSGIDWGYAGPEQGSNNKDNLYYPGGHFLGMSCGIAETNIKSCVNLSRACELGVSLSQREEINTTLNVDGKDDMIYLTPTGLISRDEINDSSFRSKFATMNFNNLKTKRDGNGYLKYDFEYIIPTNFNGELEDKVDNESYFADKVGVEIYTGDENITKVQIYKAINVIDKNNNKTNDILILGDTNALENYTSAWEESTKIIDNSDTNAKKEYSGKNKTINSVVVNTIWKIKVRIDENIANSDKKKKKIEERIKGILYKNYLVGNNDGCLIFVDYGSIEDVKAANGNIVDWRDTTFNLYFIYNNKSADVKKMNEDITDTLKDCFPEKYEGKDYTGYKTHSFIKNDSGKYDTLIINNTKISVIFWNQKETDENKFVNNLTYTDFKQYPSDLFIFNYDTKNYSTSIAKNSIRRALELPSDDYYRFRFGLNKNNIALTKGEKDSEKEENLIESRYLILTKNEKTGVVEMSLPVYENSYYFYFGLKEGNTALDTLRKKYYGVCPNEYLPITSDYESIKGDTAKGDNDKITIITKNMALPLSFELFLENSGDDNVLSKTKIRKYVKGYYLCAENGKNIILDYGQPISLKKGYILDNTYIDKDTVSYEEVISKDGDTPLSNKIIMTKSGNGYDYYVYGGVYVEGDSRPSKYIYSNPEWNDEYNIVREGGNNPYMCYKNDNGTPEEWNSNRINLQNLPKGKHKLVVRGSDNTTLDIDFEIEEEINNSFENISDIVDINGTFKLYYSSEYKITDFVINDIVYFGDITVIVKEHDYNDEEKLGCVTFIGEKPSEEVIKNNYPNLDIEKII